MKRRRFWLGEDRMGHEGLRRGWYIVESPDSDGDQYWNQQNSDQTGDNSINRNTFRARKARFQPRHCVRQ